MKLRLFVLCGLFCLAAPAGADHVYLVSGELPAEFGQLRARQLPSGAELVVAPAPLSHPALTELAVPAGHVPVLVRLDEHGPSLSTLDLIYPVLWSDDQFALIADFEGGRSGDILTLCRERLRYQPQARSVPRQFASKAADPELKQQLVDAVSQADFYQTVRELCGDLVFWLDGFLRSTDNRYTHNAEHLVAADYIQDRFESYGYTVTQQSFNVGSTTTRNVIAVKTGSVYPDEIVVVGGHYDAISQLVTPSNPNGGDAPGAEDNGTGTAAVMQLAELFAPLQTERTIHFIAFGGEEQGLYGSEHYVAQAVAANDDIIGALTMDMISYWGSNYRVIIEGDEPWEWLMSMYELNIQSYTTLGYRKDYFSFGSDHVPFQQAGIPAFLAIDWDYGSYPHYHRNTDTSEYIDPSLGVQIMKAMVATLADLAGASDPVTDAPGQDRLSLEQNLPNPFNPRTQIVFTLAESGPMSLQIFDLAGRRVRNLLAESRGAGTHVTSWDGTSDEGMAMPSGSYFYRLESHGSKLARRMTLVR
jgi:hypothetical protein